MSTKAQARAQDARAQLARPGASSNRPACIQPASPQRFCAAPQHSHVALGVTPLQTPRRRSSPRASPSARSSRSSSLTSARCPPRAAGDQAALPPLTRLVGRALASRSPQPPPPGSVPPQLDARLQLTLASEQRMRLEADSIRQAAQTTIQSRCGGSAHGKSLRHAPGTLLPRGR